MVSRSLLAVAMVLLVATPVFLGEGASGGRAVPHQGLLAIGDFSGMQLESVRVRPDGGLELVQEADYTALEPFDIQPSGGCFTSPAIGMDRQGRCFVAWEGAIGGRAPDVYAQGFYADGTTMGARTIVALGPGPERTPAVAAGANGTALVAWSQTNSTGGSGVRARLFSFDGQALGPVINLSSDDNASWPEAAAGPDGGFLVAWKNFTSGGGAGVMAQRLCSDGTQNGSVFQVSAFSGRPTPPAAGFFPDGGFLVAWEKGSDSEGYRLTAQRYIASGERNGTQFEAGAVAADQAAPDLAVNSTGGFVIAWENRAASAKESDVFFRRFTADGTPEGRENPVSGTEGSTAQPSVATGPDDRFIVAWADSGSVSALCYAADGTPAGNLPEIWRPDATGPEVAVGGDDRPLFVWQQNVTSGQAIRGRRLVHAFVATGSAATGDLRAPADLVRWTDVTAVLDGGSPANGRVSFELWTRRLGAWTAVPGNGSLALAEDSSVVRILAVLSTDQALSSPVLREVRLGYFSNQAPRLWLPPDFSAGRNTTVVIGANLSDADGDRLDSSWAQLEGPPADWTQDAAGCLTFSPVFPGTYRFRLTVSDGTARPLSAYINVTVPNLPPVAVLAVPIREAPAGRPLSFYSAESRDPDGDTVFFSYRFGDGSESGWTSEESVEHAYAGPGNYSAWLLARDTDGAETASQPVNITVTAQNRDPAITSMPAANATAGKEWTYVVTARDPDNDTLAMALTAGPPGMEVRSGWTLAWVPGPGQEGEHAVTVTVTDSRWGQATQQFILTVEPAAPAPPSCNITSPAAGSRVSGVITVRGVASAGGAPLKSVRVRVDGGIWFTASGLSQWQVRLNTLNYANGVHQLESSVQDDSGSTGNCTVVITVQNRPEPPPTIETGNTGSLVALVIIAAAGIWVALRLRHRL